MAHKYGLDGKLFTFPTNMFGYIRMMSQFSVGFTYVGYAVIYIICVLFILFFTFTYLRRVLYMAFLTMIAPLVALTYPIDKINDGSAQAFNMWIKEYIFNLLIQPMHMLLYYLLISSAFELASENFIYSIVAICFMVPAEKIIRKFFGFDKAQTPGLLAGAGGAALAMSGLKGLNRFARGNKGPGGPGGKEGKGEDNSPRFKQTNTFDKLAENGEGQQGGGNDPGQQGGENDPGQQGGGNDPGQQSGENNLGQQGPDINTEEVRDFGNTIYTNRKKNEKTLSKKRAIAKVVGRRTLAAGKKFAKSAGRTGVKVAGAAVLGMAGGLIGMATGDMKTVLSSTTAGGAIGSAIGERAANDIGGAGNRWKSFKQEIANETNDDEARNAEAMKQFRRNKEIRKIYEQELGIKGPNKKEQIDEAMKKAFEYKKYGVNNDKIIAQAMKEKGLGSKADDKKRIMAAKIAEKVNGSQKTLEDQMKRLEARGYSKEDLGKLRQAVANIDGNIT